MPTYLYEAKSGEKGCDRCRKGFETRQSVADGPLEVCPFCGAKIFRVIQAAALAHSKTDLHYRAKRAGFHTLKKIGRGEYEKLY